MSRRPEVYFCLLHDEVFKTEEEKRKHENAMQCLATIQVEEKHIEELRSIIYNRQLMIR